MYPRNLHSCLPVCMPVPRRLRAMLLPAVALALPLQAQTIDYQAIEELFGEPVTLSVTGSPQRASAVPATMEIITAEQIRRSGAPDIPSVLRHVTGVDMLQWTNNSPDLAVRGYNQAFSPRLLVLVNGRQVYADHYGYTPWSMLPVELGEIRQIEVVKGPNSALFGFNAVGGVINIVTYHPDEDIAFIELRGGSQNHRQASFAGTMALGDRARLRVSTGLRRNMDFSSPTDAANQATRKQNERKSLRLDAHVDLHSNVELQLEASWTGGLLNSMSPVYSMGYEDMVTRSVMATLAADTSFGLSQVKAYRNWIDNDVYNIDPAAPGLGLMSTPFLELDNELSVVQLQHIYKAGTSHTFRLSGEYRQGSLATTPITGGTVHYEVLAAGMMWQWQLRPELALTLSARQDMLDLGRRGSIPAGLGQTNADWDRSIDQPSYNAGLVWEVNALNTLRLTSARGVQLPSLFNLGGFMLSIAMPPGLPPLFVTGLPSLEPVTVSSHELAWEHNLQVWNAQVRVALFRGNTHDVNAVGGTQDFARGILAAPANIGDSSTRGAEFSMKGTIGDNWNWGTGYLHQDVDDRFGSQFPVSDTLVDYATTTSRHTLTAHGGWTHAAWEVDMFLRFQSTRFGMIAANPANPLHELTRIPAHTAFDARIGYRINERMDVALSGQNLLQSEQVQTAGPAVERRVFATFTYSF